MTRYVHKSEGDESADDHESIEYVPEVTTVGTRVKQYSTVDHLHTTHTDLTTVNPVNATNVKYRQHVTYHLGSISSTDNDDCDDDNINQA